MNIEQDVKNSLRDGQVVMLLSVFAISAASEPKFNKESFVAKVEDSLGKMEKSENPYDQTLLEMARIALKAIDNIPS